MILDDDAKLYLYSPVELTVDPTGSTVELEVGSTRYAMAWQGSPVAGIGKWTQTARTTAKFCGSSTTAVGTDVKLAAGIYDLQVIVTPTDGQVIPGPRDEMKVN